MDVTDGVTEHQRDDEDAAAQPPNPKVILTLSPLTGRSIDERLDALSESIRRWDWRAGDVAPRQTTPRRIERPPLRAVHPALDQAPRLTNRSRRARLPRRRQLPNRPRWRQPSSRHPPHFRLRHPHPQPVWISSRPVTRAGTRKPQPALNPLPPARRRGHRPWRAIPFDSFRQSPTSTSPAKR
jgi:hypothetical protein